MYKFGDKNYKLILLDTNVLHETVLNTHETGKGLLKKFFIENDNYAPCFSFLNVVELKPKADIYQKFINFFESMPCIMVSIPSKIIEQEYRVYTGEDDSFMSLDVLRPFSPFFQNEELKFRQHLEMVWHELEDAVKQMLLDLDKTVTSWESQRIESQFKLKYKNASPTEKKKLKPGLEILGVDCESLEDYRLDMKYYRSKEQAAVIKDIRAHGIKCNEGIDITKFPGVRLMEYAHFKKVYLASKPITKNDAMDVAISCIIPHLDAVITEASMADIYKQSKKLIPTMEPVEIYTLRDLRSS